MKNLLKLAFCLSILFGCSPNSKEVKSFEKEVMLLGVYHFDNPGLDTHNMDIDDYYSEKRQKEIEEVVSKLKAFSPTKILVEFRPNTQPKLDSLYGLYTNGDIALNEISGGRNEVYQLGFRLAKQLGLNTPIAIDHDGFWLGDYVDFIADTLGYDSYTSSQEKRSDYIAERSDRFQENTVLENLSNVNEWGEIMANHDYYNNVAIQVKDEKGIMFKYQEQTTEIDDLPYFMRSFDFNNIGVEMVVEWYKRNLFIYRNILDQTEKEDRVIVIFGSGHVRYLHQMLSDNPNIHVTNPTDYLKN
ncbi:DUF5694 domain-containing protein [Ekhidna sp.]|jgi:hypothetical protein|uniref:DUF5694 domain-containing protein n=1 Tax=Ekhidna sp. TaxID=2608089 RepID=UPI0032EC45E3